MKLMQKTCWMQWVVFSILVSGSAHAVLIDKQITIQPIQVRNSAGTVSANVGQQLYEAAADQIWSQAGIDIKFLPWATYDSDNYLTISSNPGAGDSLLGLSQVSGQAWSNGTITSTVVRLFFVQQIDGSNSNLGFTLESGLAMISGNPIIDQQTAIAIADNTFNLGYIDVIAHEIGHALGLDHTTLGAGGANNLMTAGGSKTPVTFIGDIYPNGADSDFLTGTIGGTNWGDDINNPVGYEIDRARRMDISVNLGGASYVYNQAIPEPTTTTAIAGSLMLAMAVMFRRPRCRSEQRTGSVGQA